jgi:hypothetical protein
MMVAVVVAMIVAVLVIVGVIARGRPVFAAHVKLRRHDSGAVDALGPDGFRLDRQAAERAADIRQPHPGVD